MNSENLIKNLKSDHEAVRQLIDNIFDYLSTDNKKIEFIEKLTNLLVGHIETEDKYLYPFLNKEAESDNNLQLKLDVFAKDWQNTSNFFNSYLDKYSKGNFTEEFAGDTAKLISTLRQRMMKEEISLYSEYERRIS